MPLVIKHKYVSAKADGPDTTLVKPSNWNDTHEVATDGSGGMVVGRDTSGPGPLQELPLAYDAVGAIGRWVANVVGSFRFPRGTTGQRPAGPLDGETRFNTELAVLEIFIAGSWQPVMIGSSPLFTGMVMGWYSNTAPAGWLFLNGTAIGDAGSLATHQSVAYQALFTHIWNNIDNTRAPMGNPAGARGATAAADWAAKRWITLPDECGRVTAGADNMGGIPSRDRLNIGTNPLGVDGTIMGAFGGEAKHFLTIGEMPIHAHTQTWFSAMSGVQGSLLSTAHDFDGTPRPPTQPQGNNETHNTVQPTIIRNSIIKY